MWAALASTPPSPCTRQGLTLVHFSAQPKPYLTQDTLYHPLIHLDISSTPPQHLLDNNPYPSESAYLELKSG